jgi:hypothetical protein
MRKTKARFLIGGALIAVLGWPAAGPAQAKPRIAVLPARLAPGSPVKGIVSLSGKFLPLLTFALSDLLSQGNTYEVISAPEVNKFLSAAQPPDTTVSSTAQSAQATAPPTTIDDTFRNADGYSKLRCDAIIIPSLRFDRTGNFLKLIGTVVVAPPGKITYTWGNGIRPLNVLKIKLLTASEASEQAEQALVKAAAQELVTQIDAVVSQVPDSQK